MAKKILIIEDTSDYSDVALKVLATEEVSLATDYDEAIALLGKNRYDIVLSDLFFPENSQVRGSKAQVVLVKLREWVNKWVDDDYEGKRVRAKNPKYSLDHAIIEMISIMDNATENTALGLLIAEHCVVNKIPFSIVSQGDRHKGPLAAIRNSMAHCYQVGDIFPTLLCLHGDQVDKNSPDTWLKAVEESEDTSLQKEKVEVIKTILKKL